MQQKKFVELFAEVLVKVRIAGSAPLNWNRSAAFASSKHNGKKGVRGLRLMHCFDCIGMGFFGGLAKKVGQPPELPAWTQGSLVGRAREAAILTMLSGSWRLNQEGISHGLTLYYGTNAFGCSDKRGLGRH